MIIPCIDLMGGTVVQLVRGREKALEGASPEMMLEKFAAFPVIQVIDLDAAIGSGSNGAIVEWIAKRARIRVGGGVRTVERAQQLIDCGAEKVILGTAAFDAGGVRHQFLRELSATIVPDRIIVALDSREGRIVVKGWRESLGYSAEEVVRELEPYCSGFLCTYVDKEGMMEGTDLGWFRRLRSATKLEITAAGGITDYADVIALHQICVHAALGMSIYTGRLDLTKLADMSAEFVRQATPCQ